MLAFADSVKDFYHPSVYCYMERGLWCLLMSRAAKSPTEDFLVESVRQSSEFTAFGNTWWQCGSVERPCSVLGKSLEGYFRPWFFFLSVFTSYWEGRLSQSVPSFSTSLTWIASGGVCFCPASWDPAPDGHGTVYGLILLSWRHWAGPWGTQLESWTQATFFTSGSLFPIQII